MRQVFQVDIQYGISVLKGLKSYWRGEIWKLTKLTKSCIFLADLSEVLTQLISINKTIADQSAARLEKFTRIESRVQSIQKVAQGTGFELCSCKNNNPYQRIILVKLQFFVESMINSFRSFVSGSFINFEGIN